LKVGPFHDGRFSFILMFTAFAKVALLKWNGLTPAQYNGWRILSNVLVDEKF